MCSSWTFQKSRSDLNRVLSRIVSDKILACKLFVKSFQNLFENCNSICWSFRTVQNLDFDSWKRKSQTKDLDVQNFNSSSNASDFSGSNFLCIKFSEWITCDLCRCEPRFLKFQCSIFNRKCFAWWTMLMKIETRTYFTQNYVLHIQTTPVNRKQLSNNFAFADVELIHKKLYNLHRWQNDSWLYKCLSRRINQTWIQIMPVQI